MPCGLCHKPEKNADERKDYLCGTCVCRIVGLDRGGKRTLIDSLYLQGQDEEAEFLESFCEGLVAPKAVEDVKPKKLLLRRRR